MVIEQRKAIPLPVARQLRQEAGFGCCKCGSPILQYHHIVEWRDEKHFRPEDMMVLCPLHHDQATKGAMPESEQRDLKAQPFNIIKGRASGVLEIKQDYCAAGFGSITVVGEGCFLRIDDTDIFSMFLGEKNLEISLKLYSETDELLVEIERNIWISGDPLPWDIEADWQTLTLRERARKISINLDGKTVPLTVSGEFWRSARKVAIGKPGIVVHGKSTFGMDNLALVGGGLDVQTNDISIGAGGGMIIAWPNVRERLMKAKDAWRKIKARRDTDSRLIS